MVKSLALSLALSSSIVAPATAGDTTFQESNAVLLNVTQADLNRVLRDAFHASGAARLQGTRDRASRGISDVTYTAGLSEPTLTLSPDGRMVLGVEIMSARLNIGSIERRVLRRRMHCENASVTVEPGDPVDVTLALRLAVEDRDLRIIPEQVTLANTGAFRLHRPSQCRNNPLPEFLMWWLGKGRLRQRIEKLDALLLARAREGVAALYEDHGLLSKQWRLGETEGDVFLYPQIIDTRNGSLLIGLTGASHVGQDEAAPAPEWVAGTSGSFIGLSRQFVNSAVRAALRERDAQPRPPEGGLRKLFKSDAIYALIPGLRGVESRDALRLAFNFPTAPEISFAAIDAAGSEPERAMIRIALTDVEISLFEAAGDELRWIGSADVDSALISVVPYGNRRGGISFDVVDNEWRVTSRGIEFDEETLAATFQEMVFGEVFETRFEPLGEESLDFKETRFAPSYFSRVGDYLVIGLTGL